MSTSADLQSIEKEADKNSKPHIDEKLTAPDSDCKAPEAAQTESISDWFVMVCALLCNVLNGINNGSYGVLYLPLTEMYHSSRAAVGWIMSFDFALGSILGELHFVTVVVLGYRSASGQQFVTRSAQISCFNNC